MLAARPLRSGSWTLGLASRLGALVAGAGFGSEGSYRAAG